MSKKKKKSDCSQQNYLKYGINFMSVSQRTKNIKLQNILPWTFSPLTLCLLVLKSDR